MFLWAAESQALSQAHASVDALLQRIRPSLAVLGDPQRPTGTAALVDAQQGLFLAHGDAVRGDTVQARIGDGSVRLHVLARDARTDLVLLSYRSTAGLMGMPTISVADTDPVAGSKIFVVLAEGGLVGSFVGGQRFSLVGERKQAVPVSELRFETPPQLVGGALVLSFDGKLLGTMGATVARPGNSAIVSYKTLADVQKAVQGARNPAFAPAIPTPKVFQPARLTVAYTPNLNVVRRVMDGFLSENHRAEYAALGVQVADAPGGGAVIRRVVADTPASRAGVQVGDVLLAIGDRTITKQYDFVQALLAFRPGERTTLRLRHDGVERQVEIVLARSKA